MSKYPFRDAATEYLEMMKGIYAEETWKNRERRYRRINQRLVELRDKKIISTTSPRSMTPEDIRQYILFMKDRISPADMVHELNCMNLLLEYHDNSAVRQCLIHNPGLKPSMRGRRRKPSMDDSTYQRILERSKNLDMNDSTRIRAYAFVLLCINTGCRNKEIRFSNIEDLDTRNWTFDIVHVKGEASYGQPRTVPVNPEIRGIVMSYLSVRQRQLDEWSDCADNFRCPPALFPSNKSADGYLSGNTLRHMKDIVARDLNIRFDLRECRRTFGQRFLDKGLDIESTSVLMGHASTKTTEGFYSRRRNDHAMEKAIRTWAEEGDQKEGDRCS